MEKKFKLMLTKEHVLNEEVMFTAIEESIKCME